MEAADSLLAQAGGAGPLVALRAAEARERSLAQRAPHATAQLRGEQHGQLVALAERERGIAKTALAELDLHDAIEDGAAVRDGGVAARAAADRAEGCDATRDEQSAPSPHAALVGITWPAPGPRQSRCG